MAEDKVPFIEWHFKGFRNDSHYCAIPPHFRIGRLVISRYKDWSHMTKVNHLWRCFWWVKK